ncbi:NACHT domain-containing protein [Actinokineospora globicatena]|uniref:NACHT domain-containing protein n=1 Tax=Actinokineospora globicatena TaxID=103729 RepID=UPI0020A48C70|nr:ATP-binding protein [Actinokineospora globicatena]MCP2306321.1 hypothetical protein [Actinokineospora globicatena]GLW81747.1 hypothetical protein Aglo01_62280 [Actinokineospora globicatena]GLW88542.1 hypothetical protein Aglo02_61810 [Actinokineospora globicatena]
MRRNPPMTFQGALAVLGVHDRPWLTRFDTLLGGAILSSVGIPPIADLWGLVDQKTEGIRLMRTGLDWASDKLLGTNGPHRQDLLVAAHTILVISSYFEVLDDKELSDRRKIEIATGNDLTGSWLTHLYTSPIPVPSATMPFRRLLDEIGKWAASLNDNAHVVTAVTQTYKSQFLRMAARVPEFQTWANMAEQDAIGSTLDRLHTLLSHGSLAAPGELRSTLANANNAELDVPVAEGVAPKFPTVREIFVTPRFSLVENDETCLLADDTWWAHRDVRSDLNHVFAVHFSTPAATERPLLLLGHPGAGKSLLTKVLAASLPASNYTVVRVPLRHVDANAQVDTQIQTALDALTHHRVAWPDLVRQNSDTIRVVLLDGLDELLQATTHDRTAYLADVQTFQRREAAMGHPVAVVVTSRTLVADRVTVPPSVPVVKLATFDGNQVLAWTAVWNRVNQHTGTRPLPVRLTDNVIALAEQPLLLMMLAVYYADWSAPEPTADMSLTDLYERMVNLFARREAEKRADGDVDARVRESLHRLSVAALGMLNRGAQSITELDLTADLIALGDTVQTGKRLLAEFFFVHAPQANTDVEVRAYEFLHATFGEYLVAHRIIEVLRDVADSAFGRRTQHRPDDDLLFALLSHQPLSIQRPVLDFAAARLAKLPTDEQTAVAKTLELLLAGYHERRGTSRYNYRPLPQHTVRETAAYSANLVLLRAACSDREFDLRLVWPSGPRPQWRSLVQLWGAGLRAEGLRTISTSLVIRRLTISAAQVQHLPLDLLVSRLVGDAGQEERLWVGYALQQKVICRSGELAREWLLSMKSWLISAAVSPYIFKPFLARPPESVSRKQLRPVIELAIHVLRSRFGDWNAGYTLAYLRWLGGLESSPVDAWSTYLDDDLRMRLAAKLCEVSDDPAAARLVAELRAVGRSNTGWEPGVSGLQAPFTV